MSGPVLRSISPDASAEEVAAIVAALEAVWPGDGPHRASPGGTEVLDAWVRASRLTARRAGLLRGPWRLSGRIGRRARA